MTKVKTKNTNEYYIVLIGAYGLAFYYSQNIFQTTMRYDLFSWSEACRIVDNNFPDLDANSIHICCDRGIER